VEGERSLLARETRFTRDDAEFDRAIAFAARAQTASG